MLAPSRLTLGALGLALLLTGCKSKPAEEEAAAPVRVTVAEVTLRTIAERVEVAGALEALPGLDVKLGPLTAGRLAEVRVAEGDPLTKDQLLARLDPTPFADAVRSAEAAVAEAAAAASNDAEKVLRAEKLFEAGVSARQEVDDARTASVASQQHVKTAEAALSTARMQLARSELRAPFAGVCARIFAAPGEPVDPSKPVVEVARIDVLELHAGVPARLAGRIQPKEPAEVLAEGNPAPVAASVFAVSPLVDAATGSAVVRVRVDNPGFLKVGQTARGRIQLSLHKDVPAVPRAAVVPSDVSRPQSRVAVNVVGPDGKSHLVPIAEGASDDGWVEVSGVSPGQKVIVEGAYALPDGTPVTIAAPVGDADAGAAQ